MENFQKGKTVKGIIPPQRSGQHESLGADVGEMVSKIFVEGKTVRDSSPNAPGHLLNTKSETETPALSTADISKKNDLESFREEECSDSHEKVCILGATDSPEVRRIGKSQIQSEKRAQHVGLSKVDNKEIHTRRRENECEADKANEGEGLNGATKRKHLAQNEKGRVFHQSFPTSSSNAVSRHGASVASIVQETRENQIDFLKEVHTIHQFQEELSRAIKEQDTLRFKQLLKMFNRCVAEKRILSHYAIKSGLDSQVSENDDSYVEDSNVHQSLDGNVCDYGGNRSIVDRVVDYQTKNTLMHQAVASGNVELVEACVDFGSAVHSYADFNGDTPLALALSVLCEAIPMMMLKGKDIDVSKVNIYGRSLLHHSVVIQPGTPQWSGRFSFIKFLVEQGNVRASLKDLFGCSAAMLAEESAGHYSSRKEYEQIRTFLELAEEEELTQQDALKEDACPEDKEPYSANVQNREKQNTNRDDAVNDDQEGSGRAQRLGRLPATTQKWDRVIFVILGPLTRLLCIVFLMFLHVLEYAADVADRVDASRYLDAHCEFWFTIINNIGYGWRSSSFYMSLVHFGFSFLFAVIVAVLFYYGGYFIGGRLLRLPICGARTKDEEEIFDLAFGAFYRVPYNGKARGRYFFSTLGALVGVYFGAKMYNIVLQRFWPGQLPWALISPRISGLDSATALRNFWVATLMLDWYLFVFVVDLMYQQGFLNVYLPHFRFATFASFLNNIFRRVKRDKTLCPKNLYYIRLWMHWIILLFGWLFIASVFLSLEFCVESARTLFTKVLIRSPWPGMPIVIASCCIFMECVIIFQEWTWPTFQEHPLLCFPGFTAVTHHAWFLVLTVFILSTLDMRMIHEHIILLHNQSEGISSSDTVYLTFSFLPFLCGVLLLFSTILRSSLWVREKPFALRDAHMYLLPCRLPNDTDAQLAKDIRREELLRLRRSLRFGATVGDRNLIANMRKRQKKKERGDSNVSVE